MSRYEQLYVIEKRKEVPIDQLMQLLRIVWDGDLISKSDRDVLLRMGYAEHESGFQIITPKGIRYLIDNGFIAA
jgi:hypothetical protein